MEFDVARAWWTMPAAFATAIAFVVAGWRDTVRRYPNSSFKRLFMQGFVAVAAIVFPIVIFGFTSERVRVRGEQLAVRGEFERTMREFAATDLAHYGVATRGGAPGVRGKRRHQVIVLTFTNGFVAEVPDSWDNYNRLRLWLDGQGVQQR